MRSTMPRDESGVSIKPNSLLSTHDTMGPVRLYDDTDQGCLGGFIAYDVLPKVDQERLKSIFQMRASWLEWNNQIVHMHHV